MKALSCYIRCILMIGLMSISSAYAVVPSHLVWAENLIKNITPANNVYGTNPSYVYWANVNGARTYENRTQCSPFVTHILKQAYSWTDNDFKTWFGSTNPSAAKYHDAIAAQNGFSLIQNINDIRSGDIIAVKYLNGTTTGHVMIAKTRPVLYASTSPMVDGALQYTLKIMDSSKSGHGLLDTRLMTDGTWDTGAGIGTLRLYADKKGNLLGYTWSIAKNSVFYGQDSEHHLVVGRLVF